MARCTAAEAEAQNETGCEEVTTSDASVRFADETAVAEVREKNVRGVAGAGFDPEWSDGDVKREFVGGHRWMVEREAGDEMMDVDGGVVAVVVKAGLGPVTSEKASALM